MQTVLDHIAGVLFEDRRTGKLKLRLIRDDYVADSLAVFDADSGLLAVTEASISSGGNEVNEVIVNYRCPMTNEDRATRASNLASMQASGGQWNSLSKSYPGIPVSSLAAQVAMRDLRAGRQGIRRFTLKFDRRAWAIEPGGVFRIRDPKRAIPTLVLRCARFEDNTLADGTITITAVQDVFSHPSRVMTDTQDARWTPPATQPCVPPFVAFEMPYWLVTKTMTAADFNALDPAAAQLAVAAAQGQSMNMEFRVAVRDGPATPDDTPPNNSYVCGI